ncbi:hypothetical protein EV385_5561 [Krasilnikovia cinnamomea]|uniref:Uncharacterized protein n=1 Tax=Krasilnikovia cinnamomea TaxID=349313 RepID=A0A4Q7ZR72_9ACTN|nr:hypothetical protein [Krasilnikovia cinnamomea]RZU53630.1 hypothetical protein EV385_5561 [Krasilnikovia cinnamomea]
MRYFSNDAGESTDDAAPGDRPERVQSEPVAVPRQPASSPWSDAPGDEARDSARRDRLGPDREDDPDRTQFHEPGPQPTAFGASTVGGAVAASATANPIDDRRDATGRDSDAATGAADSRSVAPGEGAAESRSESHTTTYPSGTAGSSHEDPVDVALDDRGTFEDPRVKDADDDRRPAPAPAPAPEDGGGAEEANEVAPATAPAAHQPDTLFAAADTQGLQERWRDVQLRFVDSPKEATAEAAALVEEAVDKLTAGLRSRKDSLGGESDDTEALRVQLRGYRDILNRILSL